MSSLHSHTSAGSANTGDDIIKIRLKALTDATCADCSSTRPSWASLIRTPHTSTPVPINVSTLAAFVCYHCAGHHRSLGTHICRVKSCTLDECKCGKKFQRVVDGCCLCRAVIVFSDPSSPTRLQGMTKKYGLQMWGGINE
jgi:hypothetical protein